MAERISEWVLEQDGRGSNGRKNAVGLELHLIFFD